MLFMGAIEVIFFFIFALVISMFVVIAFRGLKEWNNNNNSPRLTVNARVVSKREDVTHHTHHNGGDITGASGSYTTMDTTYYVTFQVDSGDRMEFHVSGSEYGMLAEGDMGNLSFQGTRYLSFERMY